MKFKNVLWGLILVVIGILFILRNLGYIYFSWWNFLHLWPLILVFVGISILPVKTGIKVILTIITLAVGLYFAFRAPYDENHWWDVFPYSHEKEYSDNSDWSDSEQVISEAYDSSINKALISFDAAAGNFTIEKPTNQLFEFSKYGSVGKYHYSIKEEDGEKKINIGLEGARIRRLKLNNDVKIKLNPNPVWNLSVDVGAADVKLDLAQFKVNKVDIEGGAASIYVKLGTKLDQSELSINSGATSLEIHVPEAFACEVNTDMVLSSKNMPDFNKVADGTYVTDNFTDNTKNIVINIEAAVSSLTIIRY